MDSRALTISDHPRVREGQEGKEGLQHRRRMGAWRGKMSLKGHEGEGWAMLPAGEPWEPFPAAGPWSGGWEGGWHVGS